MSSEYNKGFDAAIEDILDRLEEEFDRYAELSMEEKVILTKEEFKHKSLAIMDFHRLLNDLYKPEIQESDYES